MNRTRGAGPTDPYLPAITLGGDLEGLVAFPLFDGENVLSDLHVVALRLTLPIVAQDGDHELVWVFD